MTFVDENWDPEMSSKGYPIIPMQKLTQLAPKFLSHAENLLYVCWLLIGID